MFFAKVIADQLRFLGSSKDGALNQFGWKSVKSAVYHHEAQLKCRAAESQLPSSVKACVYGDIRTRADIYLVEA
jgi:hypothetical protein